MVTSVYNPRKLQILLCGAGLVHPYLEERALFAFCEDHERDICFKVETAVRENVIKGLRFYHFLSNTNIRDAYRHMKHKRCYFEFRGKHFELTSIGNSTFSYSTLVP